MPRFLNRLALALVILAAGNAWALGLGDIKLNSALNQPLDAEIELLSATPEELADLSIILATAETFERYGLDRPAYLQGIEFEIVENGRDGSFVRVRSRLPMTEPFLTFLVEAAWSRGRLLREYTVFLDPPTFAPPQPASQPVAAPERAAPRDTAPIQRPAPVAAPAAPVDRAPRPAPASVSAEPYSSDSSGDYTVARNETLWSIASRVRPDSRLTMNQTMLAIYRANPEAFAGNINLLKAGARLAVPSADEIFQIDRRDALSEVSRQHDSWDGSPASSSASSDSAAPEPIYQPEPEPEPADSGSLTLVPPDEESVGLGVGGEELLTEDPVLREDRILDRLEAIEAEDIPEDRALLDIRNDELARLRQELADIRGEVYEPLAETLGADESDVDSGPFVDGEEQEPVTDDVTDAAAAEEVAPEPTEVIRAQPKASLVDQVIGVLTSFWTIIAAAVVLVAGVLFWFFKRRSDAGDDSGVFERLDDDDLSMTPDDTARTQTIPPPDQGDDTILVEEGGRGMSVSHDDTVEVPQARNFDFSSDDDTQESAAEEFTSLEDTFSGETAVNMDQSDPIAEADFHMAYGLYDQAADLVNGALETDPNDKALLTKLCEIYFVWGNRDAFVDAATRMQAAVGGADSADWDKIVIMGQQIAADSDLFAGAGVAGATKEVDLTFGAGDDDGGDLDMVFGDEGDGSSDDDGGLDFMFDGDVSSSVDEDLEVTAQTPTMEASLGDATAEMPALDRDDDTVERATDSDGTAAMATLADEALNNAISESGQDADATAEIDLDDLGLDLDGLDGLDDDDFDLEINETGRNPAIDPSATGVREAVDVRLDDEDDDIDLLAATGKTQVLPDEMKVETINEPNPLIGDDAETMLASLDDDDDYDMGGDTSALTDEDATMLAPNPINEDFDYAKTEALPADAFDPDATAESPALASTDMDLDLDDLTAALNLSEAGDTVEMNRDDATVEQPRPKMDEPTAEVPTMSFGLDDMSDDLNEARTMTEVGTKLDLARAYVDMGDPAGARSILEEVLDEGDDEQRQQAQELLDALPG